LEEVGLPEASAVQLGQLALIVVKAKGVLQMLSLLIHAAMGRLGEADTVSSLSFTSLTVSPLRKRRIKVATDGEVSWLLPPLLFRVAPRPLLLLVPPVSETEAPTS
jgi:diacylglycerol kinase family enzyme